MRKIWALATIIMLGLPVQVTALNWSLNYGKDRDAVAVYNSNTEKDFTEDSPYGPMSIRVQKDNLWVLDSVGGRLLSFDKKNKLRGAVQVPNLNPFKLLEDFVFVPGGNAFWVANAEDRIIRKLDLQGKQLLALDGNNAPNGGFVQVNQMEVDSKGNLYVGDCGLARLSIFNSNGVFLREMPWQNSGFALDTENRLHLIEYFDGGGHFHKVYSPQGQLLSSTFIGLVGCSNPRLWKVDGDKIYATFIPVGGFKGFIKLYEIDGKGQIVRYQDIVPQGVMNRYVEFSGDQVYIPVANFFTAPKGNFFVKKSDWKPFKYEGAFASSMMPQKEFLIKLPKNLGAEGLLGMRASGERVVIAHKNGDYVVYNLQTGESFSGTMEIKAPLLDFDTINGKMIYIDETGRLGGHVISFWPKVAYDACRIDVFDEGLFLTGGRKAFFLSKKSTQINEISDYNFAQPVPRGFVWTMRLRPEGNWGADLTDYYGNTMGKIYEFSEGFEPSFMELGPRGLEGELLLSTYENGLRKLMFIGNNGRMFWKLDGPEKLFPRDVAFDHEENLIFLEKSNNDIWLTKWKMVIPEG
jgi:hypothetical protein